VWAFSRWCEDKPNQQHNAKHRETAVRQHIHMFSRNLQNMLACWLDVFLIRWLTVEDRLSFLQQPGTTHGQTNP
jgi:hypothetical protein